MKKAFVSIFAALALTGAAFAQEDEYEVVEYEEVVEEAPAQPAAAPARTYPTTSTAKAAPAKSSSDKPFFGIGLDVIKAINGSGYLNFVFNLNPSIALTGIFGLSHHGETTVEANSVKQDMGDDYTAIHIGAGFDYYLPSNLSPFSVGGEFIFNRFKEDNCAIDFNFLAGVHANLAKNLVLSGKAGLNMEYQWSTELVEGGENGYEYDVSRFDWSIAYKVYFTWFVF